MQRPLMTAADRREYEEISMPRMRAAWARLRNEIGLFCIEAQRCDAIEMTFTANTAANMMESFVEVMRVTVREEVADELLARGRVNAEA